MWYDLEQTFLDRDMVSRVVQSLTSQIDKESVLSVSVTVFKMKHEINEYLRRKEMRRVLSKLPVKYIGKFEAWSCASLPTISYVVPNK